MVGTVSVGKSSLTTRFLTDTFSSEYLPTIGVRVGSRLVDIDTRKIKMVVWDIEGANELTTTTAAYLQGAGGIIYVADGTRKATLTQIRRLREKVVQQLGQRPSVLIVNKRDLTEDWEVLTSDIEAMTSGEMSSFITSAKTGSGVADAFAALASELAGA